MLEDPITEITIAMELNYFQLNRAEYYVPVAMKIPGSELTLARRRGAARTSIDFIGEIKDEYGITIQNIRDNISIRLSDADAEQLARRPIQYQNGYVLLPGKYVIKVLARDATTGRIGTYQTPFVVPNLVRETQQAPISSVVLEQPARAARRRAVHRVRQEADVAALNPLRPRRPEAVPERDAGVQQEQGSATSTWRPISAARRPRGRSWRCCRFLSRRGEGVRNRAAARRRWHAPEVEGSAGQVQRAARRYRSPGRYDCQVTVLDPDTQKAAFWRMPLAVVP